MLDAGCGTGAYSQAIVGRVGRIEALDMSQGMLDAARAKLAAEAGAGHIAFQRGSIADLPFDDGSLDGVMINQVLHHLDDDADAGYPAHRAVFAEFARVLRPGGALVVNTCSQDQLAGAYWYYQLMPGAGAGMRARFMPLDALRVVLGHAGLVHRGDFVPIDAVCQGDAYFDGRGPLERLGATAIQSGRWPVTARSTRPWRGSANSTRPATSTPSSPPTTPAARNSARSPSSTRRGADAAGCRSGDGF